MTIAITAYDTSTCKSYEDSIAKITNMVERDALYNVNQGELLFFVGQTEYTNDEIPGFMHPIVVAPKKDNLVIAIDVRHYGTFDKRQGKYVLRNGLEYAFATSRAKLQYRWCTQSPNYLRDCSSVPMQIFSQWVSECVARRFSLDPGEQLNLMIVAAIYYQSCFDAVYKIDKNELVRLSTVLSRAMSVKPELIYDLAESFGEEEINYAKFIQMIEAQAPIRLKGFNSGVLQTILARTWFNSNGPEILCVALEHPPTWVSVLLACACEKTYHNSQVAKFLQRKRGNDVVDFIKIMNNFIA